MDRDELIARLCLLVHSAWTHVDPESHTASDCFCSEHSDGDPLRRHLNYANQGKGLEFVERAVRAAIARGDE